MTDPYRVQAQLQVALGKLTPFSTCALLNYPNHINLGDHLIWLGNLVYLSSVMKARVAYTASSAEFSPQAMEQAVGTAAPILLHGGGSLGDIWHSHQRFREKIIQRYPDRSIVILPQTMHFQDPIKLEKAAQIFNAHPDLTIFARDRTSYALAQEFFHNCKVWLAPDTAFQLTHLADFPVAPPQQKILYHCRTDVELLEKLSLPQLPLPIEVSDWRPYEDHWVMGSPQAPLKQRVTTVIRAGWQRGIRHPNEWLSRRQWEGAFCPQTMLDAIHHPARQHQSWSFIHSAVYQFRQYRLIVTNRLHGHILATLLGIPHVFLPNSYHKNQAFYQTWTAEVPYCRFVTQAEQIPAAVTELLHLAHPVQS